MKLNLLKTNYESILLHKKNINFCTLQSDRSHIKFRLVGGEILIKINNNLSIRIKVSKDTIVSTKDNQLRLMSKDLINLNQLVQKLSKFAKIIAFT